MKNVLGALTVGENVGWSTHLDDLHPRLMASPAHRGALLDPRFTVAGFAVMHDTDGLYYVTQDFIQPSGTTPPPPPAPPAPPSGDTAPARLTTPAPAPGRAPAVEPVVAETALGPADPSVDGGQGTVEETELDGAGIDVEARGELAPGEVAGVISENPAPTPPAGRSGPVAFALALWATVLGGLGWSHVGGRGSGASTAMRQQPG